MLSYAYSIVGLDKGDGVNLGMAKEQVKQIKSGLTQVRQNGSVESNVIREMGAGVTALELLVDERLGQLSSAKVTSSSR